MLPAISEGVGWNLRPRRSQEGRPLIDEAAYEHTTLGLRMTLDDTVYIDIFVMIDIFNKMSASFSPTHTVNV